MMHKIIAEIFGLFAFESADLWTAVSENDHFLYTFLGSWVTCTLKLL